MTAHRLHRLHRFGEVIARVYEHYFYVFVELGGEVDEHAVGHGRSDADVRSEGAEPPFDDFQGIQMLKLFVDFF